jgi:6-phosphogluconolactonase
VKNNLFELITLANSDDLACAVAGKWLDEIEAANRAGANHSVALSGGRITQKFFVSTVEQARARKTSFERVHFFWADERCVSADDPESNFKLAKDLLFGPLQIPEKQIHRLRGEDSPEAALKIAEQELRQFATPTENQPILDLIFLGMGEDGHVASLFPNAKLISTKDVEYKDSFQYVSDSPKPPPRRISLNYNAIAKANAVWVLVSGVGKEIALQDSLSNSKQTPLGAVIRMRNSTVIYSDIKTVN